ncbi:MAG: hypothetical protein KAH23_07575 [Kiritimatiellae bacterium]|nr:hypothetical protein [Kiritimatiellia bacterium]
MKNYFIMFAVCVVVIVSTTVVLMRFFKRLGAIEEERWGKKKDWTSGLEKKGKKKGE